jgi:hypothetical protein
VVEVSQSQPTLLQKHFSNKAERVSLPASELFLHLKMANCPGRHEWALLDVLLEEGWSEEEDGALVGAGVGEREGGHGLIEEGRGALAGALVLGIFDLPDTLLAEYFVAGSFAPEDLVDYLKADSAL